MLPWSFSEEAALEKYASAPARNMWGDCSKDGRALDHYRWRRVGRDQDHADPLYQHLIVTAERKFWRCVENGEPPALFGVNPPKPRIVAVQIVNITASNAWAEFAAIFSRRTRNAHQEHEVWPN